MATRTSKPTVPDQARPGDSVMPMNMHLSLRAHDMQNLSQHVHEDSAGEL